MYTPFSYNKINEKFHYFPSNGCYVGFNFPSQQHAKHFYKVVIKTSEERNELIKKLTKSSRQSKMFSSCDVEENAKAKTPRMSIKSQSVDVYTEDEVTVRTCLLFIV
jgi:hypothetical protein